MPVQPSLLNRRQLSPRKLRAARLRAGFDNISEVCRRIGLKRFGYRRWEDATKPPLTYFDYVAFQNVLNLFGVQIDEVTDPIPDGTPEPTHV